MCKVKQGDKVKVHYTGRLEDGTVFDSSEGRDPMTFEIGSGQVIPGVDQGVLDMKEGDSRTLTIEPDNAYGPKRDELIAQVKKSVFPSEIKVEIGQQLQMEQSEGESIPVVISAIDGDDVTLDANHPLAGKTLIFDIKMAGIL